MKLKKFLVILAVALCATACEKNVADSVVGNYKGTIDMSVAGESAGTMDISVAVTKITGNTVSLTIVNDAEATTGMSIRRLQIDDVTVTDNGNSTYSLTKTIPENGLAVTDTESEIKTVWTITSFSGNVEDKSLTLNILAQPGAMPMPITLVFTGTI